MKKEKTMHDLAKEFPDKTYRELEKYRDADRVEEAIGIGHNHPPKEEQTGVCMIGEMRKDREEINWEEKYNKERKLRQEAEGETSIVKGIGQHSPEMKKAVNVRVELINQIKQLQTRLAESLQINEAHHLLNGKLQERLTEVEEENKKMHDHLNKKIESARKAGL